MKKVVLVTGHYWKSKRKAGFHWLADSFYKAGWEVLFFTCSISWLSYIRKDWRIFCDGLMKERNKMIKIKNNLWSYVWFTCFHPANLRLGILNLLSYPIFNIYKKFNLGEAEGFIKNSDLIIFESTPGILLVKRFRNMNKNARIVYRVSDDIRFLKNHPIVINNELGSLPLFDMISAPSEYFKTIFPSSINVNVHYHAINKELFDRQYINPYKEIKRPNIVFVGTSYLDKNFIEIASMLFPYYNFHIIGPFSRLPRHSNIFVYGEMPFIETVPYIKYADVGLATWNYKAGAESLSDSLKIIQYTYCKLPIIVPEFIKSKRPNIIHYKTGDVESIKMAIEKALSFDRENIYRDNIYSWEELIKILSG